MTKEEATIQALRNHIEVLEENIRALDQGQKYCDRNICTSNTYNGIGCDECEVTKSREKILEPCEDCVSRQAVYFKLTNGAYSDENTEQFSDRLIKELEELPPVTPKGVTVTDFADKCRECGKQKKGKWIKSEVGGAKVCSVCQSHMGLSNFKYCPNCGAEMEREE